jgi:hypothetical protein
VITEGAVSVSLRADVAKPAQAKTIALKMKREINPMRGMPQLPEKIFEY